MAVIPFFKPALFRKDMDAVLQTMVDEKIGPGEKKRAFVKAFCSYASRKDGVALRSYIDAIVVAFHAMGLKEGESVAMSVFTPLIYLDAMKRMGLKSILTDVDDEMMPDTEGINKALQDGAKALVLFLPIGNIPSEGEKFRNFGLPILEDITQSVGSRLNSVGPGKIGNIVIAATEEDSIVSTAGGAVLMSDNDEMLEFMKKEVNPYVELPDLNASLGVVQLMKIESIVQRRSNIYRLYADEARRKGRVKVFGMADVDFSTNGYGFSCITQDRPDDVIEEAKKYSVTVQKTFSKAVGSRYRERYDRFPKAFPYLSRSVSMPLYPFLSNADIQTVQKVISVLR